MHRRLLASVFAAVLVLAACGDDDDVASEPETTSQDGSAGDDASAVGDGADGGDLYGGPASGGSGDDDDAATAPVTTAGTALGEVLVDADGFTLYGFTNDTEGEPTCTEACAENWPPVFVDSSQLPEGLDPAVFSVVEHPSGKNQLKAGDWPLYRFAADEQPGDTSGQGVNDVWFVVDAEGRMIRE